MSLILLSEDYQSLLHCLCTYQGSKTLGNLFIYHCRDMYYCVLDDCYFSDFADTSNVEQLKPFTMVAFTKKFNK